MKIAFNALLLDQYNTGVENYISCLLNEFNKISAVDVHVFLKSFFRQNESFDNLKQVYAPALCRFKVFRILYEHTTLSTLNPKDFDLIHSPGYIAPIYPQIPTIVTIHDVIAFKQPLYCSRLNALYYKAFMPLSVRNSSKIITASQFVKKDLLRLFKVASEKIVVIPESVRDIFHLNISSKIKKHIQKKYSLPEKFILFVGNLEPKKNIEFLLDVYEAARSKIKNLGLVLVGRIGWRSHRLQKKLAASRKNEHFRHLGYVSDNDLPTIYQMADVFLFPSLTEGFGIPPLEAMASSVPVLASNRGALPEVIGDAGIMIDPTDFSGYVNALTALFQSTFLSSELKKKGLKRVKEFTWKRCTEMTINVYRDVIQ